MCSRNDVWAAQILSKAIQPFAYLAIAGSTGPGALQSGGGSKKKSSGESQTLQESDKEAIVKEKRKLAKEKALHRTLPVKGKDNDEDLEEVIRDDAPAITKSAPFPLNRIHDFGRESTPGRWLAFRGVGCEITCDE